MYSLKRFHTHCCTNGKDKVSAKYLIFDRTRYDMTLILDDAIINLRFLV